MGKNASSEESACTKREMARIFHALVEKPERFQLVYAFNTTVSTTSFIIRETRYTYISYILGYTPDGKDNAPEIVLVETEPSLTQYGEVLHFPRRIVRKARYGRLTTNCTLRVPALKKGYIEFCVPEGTDDPELYPPVMQEEEARDFTRFFTTCYISGTNSGAYNQTQAALSGKQPGSADYFAQGGKGIFHNLFNALCKPFRG